MELNDMINIRLPQYNCVYNHICSCTPQGYKIKTDNMQNISVYKSNSKDDRRNLILLNLNIPYLIVKDVDEKEKSANFDLINCEDITSNQFVLKDGDYVGIIRNKKEDKAKQYIEITSENNNL